MKWEILALKGPNAIISIIINKQNNIKQTMAEAPTVTEVPEVTPATTDSGFTQSKEEIKMEQKMVKTIERMPESVRGRF